MDMGCCNSEFHAVCDRQRERERERERGGGGG